jgi:hypothetical protein
MKIQARYESALKAIPAPGGAGCHTAILGAANLGIMAGLSEIQILADIRASIPRGGRNVPDREISAAIDKARRECEPLTDQAPMRGSRPAPPPKPKPPFDGPTFRQRLIQANHGATHADLWELSPIRIDWEPGPQDAAMLVYTLYAPAEIIFAGGVYDRDVFAAGALLDAYKRGNPPPPHIIPNPMDGNEHETGSGTVSRRCDAAVSAFRFAVVEFDDIPKADQVAFWYSIIKGGLLPVAALIDSGGKSIHAWLRVDLPDAAAWDSVVRRDMYDKDTGRLALLGADRACQNQSRLSRMPGHYRAEKESWQLLLYLNPEPANREAKQ